MPEPPAHDECEQNLAAARRKVTNLEIALRSARDIGAAVGVLMERHKISNAAAFEILRGVSSRTHRKVRDVADHVLFSGSTEDV